MAAESFGDEGVGIYILTRCWVLCVCFAGEDSNFLNALLSCDALYSPDILRKKNMLLSLWFAALLGLVASVLGSIVRINALGDSITGSPVCFPFTSNFFTRTSNRPTTRSTA
jgi:hypothetical protein